MFQVARRLVAALVELAQRLPIPPEEVVAIARWVTKHGDELVRALDEYDTAWPGGSSDRDTLAAAASAQATAEGSLSHETLQRISAWGFRRQLPGLDEEGVRTATRDAFRLRDAGDHAAAVRKLRELDGVGPSTATKILALTDRKRSAIYDSRAASALTDLRGPDGEPLIPIPPGRAVKGSANVEQVTDAYPHYLLILRAIVVIARATPRLRALRSIEDVEKALFAYARRRTLT